MVEHGVFGNLQHLNLGREFSMQGTESFIGACWEQIAIFIDHPDSLLVFNKIPSPVRNFCIRYVIERMSPSLNVS